MSRGRSPHAGEKWTNKAALISWSEPPPWFPSSVMPWSVENQKRNEAASINCYRFEINCNKNLKTHLQKLVPCDNSLMYLKRPVLCSKPHPFARVFRPCVCRVARRYDRRDQRPKSAKQLAPILRVWFHPFSGFSASWAICPNIHRQPYLNLACWRMAVEKIRRIDGDTNRPTCHRRQNRAVRENPILALQMASFSIVQPRNLLRWKHHPAK